MAVRETAAEHLEERQSDWAYSKPVVIVDVLWNVFFVIVALVVLYLSRNEAPPSPLRLWIGGYAVQCVMHVVCVSLEYRRRCRRRQAAEDGIGLQDDAIRYVSLAQLLDGGSRISRYAKHDKVRNVVVYCLFIAKCFCVVELHFENVMNLV